MIFGKDSKVNVETLLATTHRITRKTANTFEINNSGNGSIINLGQLAANNIYLIGRDVLNAGNITADKIHICMLYYAACDGIIFIVQAKINPAQGEGDFLAILHIALLFAGSRTKAALVIHFYLSIHSSAQRAMTA